ncbi:hypothetical protein Y88_0677 [Novosphingobium nitrogenifigens DSM 19370]|uniref:NAD-dependent epimerase/dehydratase domain-containing protein n=2 Tax=Novosphingobium nitrogenifigens TaxID=378548 RepID=F1Z9X2_9SPHN|nr:hypothetical protein Y88_0677 [Novosphingobium nitrogenifigens DSM 19370]
MDSHAVARASADPAVIVHAVNPPGYRDWDRLVLPMIDNTIAAAIATGATIVLPGTVYNYGPDVFPFVAEDAAQHPLTRKGIIRVAMEQRLRDAAEKGARVLIVRAGDFFGPHAGNNWFGQGLVKPGKIPRAITYPGKSGIGHQWTYLPDLAETMARLLERPQEDVRFERFHMGGHWDPDGTAMIDAIRAAVGRALPVRRFPWWIVRLAAPAVPLFGELSEMRYLWRTPLQLDNTSLKAAIGNEPHTPLAEAVRETLLGLGCIADG